MELDYTAIGKRIARRRKQMNLTQAVVEERADISDKYLSKIERSVSIPSIEVIMSLAIALETTPDEFLVGTARYEDQAWRSVAEGLRGLSPKQLELTAHFLEWVREQPL